MTKISIKRVAVAMTHCVSNAADLASDADLLRAHARNARAFLLYTSAAEELAKYFMLEIVGRKLRSRSEINWTRFWQRLRTHDAKMAQAAVRVESFGHLLDEDAFDRARAGALIWRKVGTKPRNRSLYVEVEGGKIGGPADIDWTLGVEALKGLVDALLVGARMVGMTEVEIAASFAAPSVSNPITSLYSEVGRLKAEGHSGEEIRTLVDKIWNLTKPKNARPLA
jgi:AbiV family abortive infection protein